MKHTKLLLTLAFAAGIAAPAFAQGGAKGSGKPGAKGVAAKKVAGPTEDQKALDAYLKELSKKWGFTITLDPKGGGLVVQFSPAGKEKLTVDMAEVKTEDDIEAKLIAKLTEAKKIEKGDSDGVPVFYQTALLKDDQASIEEAMKTSKAGGQKLKRVVVSPKKAADGALAATFDLDNYAYQQVKLGKDSQSSEVNKGSKSAYFNYNEWLKKKAAIAAPKGDKEGASSVGNSAGLESKTAGVQKAALANTLGAVYDNTGKLLPGYKDDPNIVAVDNSVRGGEVKEIDGQEHFVYTQPGAHFKTAVPLQAGPGGKADVEGAAQQVADQIMKGSETGAKAKAALAAVKNEPAGGKVSPAPGSPNLAVKEGAGSSAGASDPAMPANKVGGAGCHNPADIFRSDAERYKAHQESELADKANANQKQREKINDAMNDKIEKINAACAEKLADPMIDGPSKKAIEADCAGQVKAAKKDALGQLTAISRKDEAAQSEAARTQTSKEIEGYYNIQIAKAIPGIQKDYKTGTDEQGISKKAALAEELGIDPKYMKDKYIDDYFAEHWQGKNAADSINGCRTGLGVGTNPTAAAIDGSCIHGNLVSYIKAIKGHVNTGAPSTGPSQPAEPGDIDQQINEELRGKKK